MRLLSGEDFHGGALVTEARWGLVYWIKREDDYDWLQRIEESWTFEDGACA